MIAQCPKCGGKRIEMWLCLREAGCTARPRCESAELRQPPLPFDGEYHAHRRLDAAVFAAYGWPADLDDEAILERLLALNLERAGRP